VRCGAIIRTNMTSKMAKEDQACQTDPSSIHRRKIITAAGVGSLALAGSAVITGLGLQRFLYPNVGEQNNPRVKVGDLSALSAMLPKSLKENFKKQGLYIIRCRQGITALSTACTHLGCTLNWVESERKFKCPCHGSGFSQEGLNLEGPAPRPMERFKISVDEGRVTVDRSQVFRQEKGEWAHPDSIIRT